MVCVVGEQTPSYSSSYFSDFIGEADVGACSSLWIVDAPICHKLKVPLFTDGTECSLSVLQRLRVGHRLPLGRDLRLRG